MTFFLLPLLSFSFLSSRREMAKMCTTHSHPAGGGCWCLFIQLRLSHKFRTFCGFYWNSISWLIHPNSDHSDGGCQWSPLGQCLRVSGCTQERKQVLQFLLRFQNGLWAYFQRPKTAGLGTWGGVMGHVVVFPRDIFYFAKPRQSVTLCF